MTIIRGTHGDDNLSGTSGDDNFILTQGGNDTVSGGDGNDIFQFGATLTAADHIDGGNGKDAVSLKGDYSAGLTFAADTMVNVETLTLIGNYDYRLTTDEATVAAGATLLVKANGIGGGHSLVFDGSAETDGHFRFVATGGNDVLTGGAKSDVFHLENGGKDIAHGAGGYDIFYLGGALTAGDQINGGSGGDTLVLDGDYSDGLILGAATIQQIETLQLAAGHDYNLTSADANVAIHATLTVDASALGAGDTASFVGTAETNGAFIFKGGLGQNFFEGGAGNDQFDFVTSAFNEATGGGGNDVFTFVGDVNVDQIDGGSGNNTMDFIGDYAHLDLTDGNVANIQTIAFEGLHEYFGATVSGDISGGVPLTIDASTMPVGGELDLDASGSSNAIVFHGGAGLYTITGSSQSDTFDLGAGFSVSDSMAGGGGNDTLALNGDYTLGFGPSTITGIETITLAAGHDYALGTDDNNVASGETLTIDASALGAGDTLTFFGTQETDGAFHIISHAGSAFLVGGGGDDIFDVGANAFSPSVTLVGGNGTDTVVLDGVYAPGTNISTLALDSIEIVKVAAGHSYNLVESGSFYVGNIDASSLGTGDHLIFDSSGASGGVSIRSGAGSDYFNVNHVAENVFHYEGIALSGDTRDTISDFNTSTVDKIAFHTVNAVDPVIFGGTLDNANFDSELASAIGAAQLHAGDAVVFNPFNGDLGGNTFLIVDGNGVAGYQAGFDLVIDITGGNFAVIPANFIA
jgi:hypothetical protein